MADDDKTAAAAPTVTVLIADDDSLTRHVWGRILKHLVPGLVVLDAGDGDTAVRLARDRRPDIIVMDLAMPGLDGLEATRRLRSDPATVRIPIIAVTGVAYGSQAVLDAGCNGYLVKPVEPEALVREITRVLRRPLL